MELHHGTEPHRLKAAASHWATLVWVSIAIVLPTLLLFALVARWTWNHFLQNPLLHDAGWLSATVYHAGLLPKNPSIVSGYHEFFSIHFAPVLSMGSLLSYLVPLGRVPYFCLYQAALTMPLGAVVPMLVGWHGHDRKLLDAILVALSAMVFAFNGQIAICVVFPHFEILVSSGLCLMLVGLALGKLPIAWLGICLTVITREDGGLHSAALIAAALGCDLSGRPWRVARRKLLLMFVFAVGCSMTAMLVQKLYFPPSDVFQSAYLGRPPYAHVTFEVFLQRFQKMFVYAGFVSYPFLATVMIAVAKRDARYLLGWLVEVPWWLVNLLAVEDLKSTFGVYTGFPFVGSLFWVAAYARCNQVDARTRYWLLPMLFAAVTANLGLFVRWPTRYLDLMKSLVVPKSLASGAVTNFASSMVKNPRTYGHLLIDPAVASWTLESIPAEDFRWHVADIRTYDGYDGATFFAREDWANATRKFLLHSPFKNCGRIRDTEVYCCLRPELPLPPQFVGPTAP
jgi:hypothetical protein